MYGSANCTPRVPWNPALRWTKVTSDSSFAARATSTTSSTALSTTSCSPTLLPVVQNRQLSDGL